MSKPKPLIDPNLQLADFPIGSVWDSGWYQYEVIGHRPSVRYHDFDPSVHGHGHMLELKCLSLPEGDWREGSVFYQPLSWASRWERLPR